MAARETPNGKVDCSCLQGDTRYSPLEATAASTEEGIAFMQVTPLGCCIRTAAWALPKDSMLSRVVVLRTLAVRHVVPVDAGEMASIDPS